MPMHKLTPHGVYQAVIELIQVGLVPFVKSSPGLGKSSIYAQIAKEFNLEMIDVRLSQCTPEDLMGLPMRDGHKASFMPFKMFPLVGDPLPKGKNGWLLNLDEFNSASKSVQAAAYKIVLDRMVGQEHLHDNVFIVCAGNLETDRAIVNQMSTAMQSRLIHLEMVPSKEELMNYAVKAGWDARVLGFLEYQPDKLHVFNPDHNDNTFACPRTWEFLSRYVKGKTTEELNMAIMAGTVSEGIALEFATFAELSDQLPKYAEIEKAPKTVKVPRRQDICYATIFMLLDHVEDNTFIDVVPYVHRMPPELQVIFFRGIIRRFPQARRTREYVDSTTDLMEFIFDDNKQLEAE